MFRRATSSTLSKSFVQRRAFTDYQHHHYPSVPAIAYGIPALFGVYWLIWMRIGSLQTKRSDYKKDLSRVWRRKLGSGYKWADEVPAKVTTFFKDLPSGAK